MLFEPLFKHATTKPQAIAAIDERGRYTYQQVAAMATGLGVYLAAQTSQPRVGLLLPSSAGFAASFFGTLLAGKGVVPINFLLGDREIAHVVADSGIDTVVTIPQLAPRLKDTPMKVIDLTALPPTPPAIAPKLPSPAATDTAVLIYTSGTSGLPKGVELTYGNLQSCIDAAIAYAALKGEHKFLGVVPMFHSLGLTATLLAPFQLGATVVYQARFSAVAAMNAIREHQISLLFAVPSMFGALLHLKNASADDFKQTYAVISGGEPLSESIREKFRERFGIPLLEGYGLTETCGPITINVPQAQRAGSVGRPVPGAEARIVDEEAKPVAIGQTGEVWLKGPMVMKGYYHLAKETADVLTADGCFKTGDLGKVDEDGYLYITGRKKEMIIVAGEKASPREIEDVLMRHPAVADAAVVGKKDPSRGEVVVAFVVAKEGQTIDPGALRDFARDQGLAQWKCPREVRVVEELPRSPTGKVLKRVLADQLAQP
ncbi:MAG: AMP-binding protein [Tepidisphaeraceae bacterium]